MKTSSIDESLQASPLTYSDHIANSIAALYSILSPEKQSHFKDSEKISQFKSDLSTGYILESFIENSFPQTNNQQKTNFFNILQSYSEKYLSSSINEWQFIIDGPPHSGKSTLLLIFAQNMVKRLRICNQLNRVFVFTMNWENALQQVTDYISIYDFIITQTIQQTAQQNQFLYPITKALIKWFLDIPHSPNLKTLPLSLSQMPKFPTTSIEMLGKNLNTVFKSPDNPALFVQEITSFPNNFSSCFGFEKTLFIYDHVDIDYDITLSTEADEQTFTPIINGIIRSLSRQYFVASVKTGQIDTTKLKKCKFVKTDDSIPYSAVSNLKSIVCSKPSLTITPDMCHGCPQILHRYLNTLKYIDEVAAAEESQRTRGLYSILAKTKFEIAKSELERLCMDLMDIEEEGFNEGLIDTIHESEEIKIASTKN